jgi:hypothetical protein
MSVDDVDDEGFIPYLVLVRFDKDGGDLKRRLAESVPALKEALADMGKVQFVDNVVRRFDGSLSGCGKPEIRGCVAGAGAFAVTPDG